VSTSYKVKVNNVFDFEVDTKEDISIDIVNTSKTNYHVLSDHTSYKATILSADFNQKKYTIEINNNKYTVDISNELDVLIKDMGFSIGSAKKVNSIKAPMPGLILDISVKVGTTVEEGDTLLILEAMKMENSITSPRKGIIKAISVDKEATVEKNQLLIEFE